MLKILSLKFE